MLSRGIVTFVLHVVARSLRTLRAPVIWPKPYCIVAHGFDFGHVPESVPLMSTKTAEVASAHVPFDSRQIPLEHSLSAMQPRQLFALPSQTGASAVVHIT